MRCPTGGPARTGRATSWARQRPARSVLRRRRHRAGAHGRGRRRGGARRLTRRSRVDAARRRAPHAGRGGAVGDGQPDTAPTTDTAPAETERPADTAPATDDPQAPAVPATTFEGSFVSLDHPTSGNIGDQNYELPPGIDLSEYSGVVCWCVRFSSPFGGATLMPV